MAFLDRDFPMEIHISFDKLIADYKKELRDGSHTRKQHAQRMIDIVTQSPELVDGLTSFGQVEKYKDQINELLEDIFSPVLQKNEIKVASLPFQEQIIKSTSRYDAIIKAAGSNYKPTLKNFDEDSSYIMGCSVILQQYYGYKIDFRRPFFYQVPDNSGIMRHYRLLYNGDFISIKKKENTQDITQEDVNELLDNFDNIDLWKSKFPPRSWIFKGFVIANLFDATADVALSDFKTSLLKYDKGNETFTTGFQDIFKAIFNLPDIQVGFSNYNDEEEALEKVPFRGIDSFVLNTSFSKDCKSALCKGSFQTIIQEKEFFTVSDVEKYSALDSSETFYSNLLDQNIRSAIFAPIVNDHAFLGLMEIVSPNKHDLNSINANKLLDVMPYLVDSVKRSKSRVENELEVIIQNECTSIHPSVYWKFKQEAKRVMRAQIDEDASISFRDIVFKDVFPLFGQIDIKGSSEARNNAVQKDLILQLNLAQTILESAKKTKDLIVYDEFLFRLKEFKSAIEVQIEVDSEQNILNFLTKDISPFFDHLYKEDSGLAGMVKSYREQLQGVTGLIYKNRKNYDDSVMLMNKRLAGLLDKKQKEAQSMYPHFFERFKTDGVEHNMYIGESITRENSFNKVYLYNLRLWQLQVMCEMENEHYKLSRKLPHPLEVASMILVFNTSLSVRFRMDEKRFDVDGTYNARYEVVKKRVDKAFIKGSEQRVTEKGKIAIVYSQKEDEIEYMRYIKFLQSKKYLGPKVEIVELEDLQSVTGLKAIRVDVLYKREKGKGDSKKYYNYEDLMAEIKK